MLRVCWQWLCSEGGEPLGGADNLSICRRRHADAFTKAMAEMAGVGIAALFGDLCERQPRGAQQRAGAFEPLLRDPGGGRKSERRAEHAREMELG